MWIFNFDGLELEMCGNGICCLVKFLVDLEGVEEKIYCIYMLVGVIMF